MMRILKKLNTSEKLLLLLYGIVLLGLFLYSFTQIDLSLTFSRIDVLRNTVGFFQHIGYFDRPLSTYLYISIVVLLYIFYIIFLICARKKKISKAFVWVTIILSAIILVFSYNAFSYDIFNYIFDSKIITHYHENPYQHKALDYPGDPMLSFMRWTHRVYPYGPVWLGLTLPLSFIGFQVFLLTFFLFKLLMAASFVVSAYFIGKIFQKIAPEREVFGLLFFALNPLVLIESLVSGHLDIVMMAFSLWAFYTLLNKQYTRSYIALALSIGIKFVTAFLLPVFLLITIYQKKHKTIPWGYVFGLAVILLVTGVIAESHTGTFQPWYLLAVLPFAVFVAHRYIVLIPAVIISLAALLNYVPFLFVGNWDKPIPQILSDMNFFSYCLSFFVVAVLFGYNQLQFARHAKKNKKTK
jgi:hypothetical protein